MFSNDINSDISSSSLFPDPSVGGAVVGEGVGASVELFVGEADGLDDGMEATGDDVGLSVELVHSSHSLQPNQVHLVSHGVGLVSHQGLHA